MNRFAINCFAALLPLFAGIAAGAERTTVSSTQPTTKPIVLELNIDGKYHATIETTEMPELTQWAERELAPVVREWYPKLVKALPSDGFEAPRQFSITFKKGIQGVAYTAGTRIICTGEWFAKQLKGEARGAIVHEMVHVVQQYGLARRNPKATRNPGWLVEGIPDYLRWYHYEPQSKGAEISKRSVAKARYDGSYRVSANFLNWAIAKYDKDLIANLNAAMRQGNYKDELWATWTGKPLIKLGDEWKNSVEAALGVPLSPPSTRPAAQGATGG